MAGQDSAKITYDTVFHVCNIVLTVKSYGIIIHS